MTAAAKSVIPKDFITGREPTLTFLVVLVIGLGLYYLNGMLALSTSLADVITPTIYNALFSQLVTYYPTGLFVFLNTIFSWIYSFPSILAWFVGGLVLGILLKKKAKKFVAFNQSSDVPVVISKAEVSKAWVVWGLFRVSLFFIAITYAILGVAYVGLTLTGSTEVDLLTGIAGFMLYVLTLFLSPVFWMQFAFVALGGAIGTSMARRASTSIAREAGAVSVKSKGKEISKKEKMLAAYQPAGKVVPSAAPPAPIEGSQLRIAGAAVPKVSGKAATKGPQTVPAVPAPAKAPVTIPPVSAPTKAPEVVPSVPAPAKVSAFPPVPAPIKGPEPVPAIPAPVKAPVAVPAVPAPAEKPVPKMPVVTPFTPGVPQPSALQAVSAPLKPAVTVPTPAPAAIVAPAITAPAAPIVEEPATPEEEQFFKQVMTGMKLVMTKLDNGEIIDPAFVSNLLYLLRTRRKKFEQQGAASKIKKVDEMYQKTEQLQAQVRARAKPAPEKK